MNCKIFLLATTTMCIQASQVALLKENVTNKQKLTTHEIPQPASFTISSDAEVISSFEQAPKPDLTFFVYEFSQKDQEQPGLEPVAREHITFKFAQAVLENNCKLAQDYAQQGANPNAFVCTFLQPNHGWRTKEDDWDNCSMPLIFRAVMHEQVEMVDILAHMPHCKLDDSLYSYRDAVLEIGAFFDRGSANYRSYIDCTLLQCLAEGLYKNNLKYKNRPYRKFYERKENEQMTEILLHAGANPAKGDYWHIPFELAIKREEGVCALHILKYLTTKPWLNDKTKEYLCKKAIHSLSPEHVKTLIDNGVTKDTFISENGNFVSFYGGGRVISCNNYISLLSYAAKNFNLIWEDQNREIERKRLYLIIKQLMRPCHLKQYALTDKESMGLGNTVIYDTLLEESLPDTLINIVLDYEPMSQKKQ